MGDARQTEQFFAPSWGQYEGVDEAGRSMTIMAEAPGTVWADVTWTYGGRAQERFCYPLVETPDGYRIAVLTPLARSGPGPGGSEGVGTLALHDAALAQSVRATHS